MRFFFETESWRLFSILFGLSFSLQLLRAEARGLPLVRSKATWGIGLGVASMAIERLLALLAGYNVWGDGGANVILELMGDTIFAYGATALSFGCGAAIVPVSRGMKSSHLVKPLGAVGEWPRACT